MPSNMIPPYPPSLDEKGIEFWVEKYAWVAVKKVKGTQGIVQPLETTRAWCTLH